ncbi:DUF61 family protein [Methanolobus sp.]|uniref:DUF61 family protein n=1 Tax=Methanolobus sp. TaxID=1874737 RepID=UPI0025D616E6|nr:DUF61 family protein [Methanolobus sp.]
MPERRTSDDDVLMRWMRTEVTRINEGIVTERKILSQLLSEERPASRTKGGEEYLFDKGVLAVISDELPTKLRYKLKLSILFFYIPNAPDSCCLNDPYALEFLQIMGDMSRIRRMQKNKI